MNLCSNTAVIPVHQAASPRASLAPKQCVAGGVAVAHKVPGGPCPLGHGVSLRLGAAAAGTGGVYSRRPSSPRGFAIFGGLMASTSSGRVKGQLYLRQGNIAALHNENNGGWVRPSNAGGRTIPVRSLWLTLGCPFPSFFQPGDDLLLGLNFHCQAVQKLPELTIMPRSR